jgi:hypothetical protein
MRKVLIAFVLNAWVGIVAIVTPVCVIAGTDHPAVPSTEVGISTTLEDVVISGPLVRAKMIADSMTPVVLRVLSSEPVDGGYRYDLEFYALEPGDHNLADYLERTQAGVSVPDLMVRAVTSLADPNAIELRGQVYRATSWFPWYTVTMGVAIVMWCAGLWWLLTSGKKAVASEHHDVAQTLTAMEQLVARVGERQSHQLNNTEQAELERLVYLIWRELKGIDADAAEAVLSLKGDPQAGPMLRKFEQWLHTPKRGSLDLSEMLQELRERAEVAVV